MHSSQLVDAVDAACLPEAHVLQLVDVALAAYVPFRQSVHSVAAVFDILPALQSSQLLAPTLLAYFPGSQFVQVDDAALAVYVPSMQSVHA